MSNLDKLTNKICSLKMLKKKVVKWKQEGKKIVFTNGCFDLVHRGHIEVLAKTADLGDKLIIGINTDKSIRELKGKNRPIIDEESRLILLSALAFVDAIILFNDPTPISLISVLQPDILAKGGDYKIEDIVGSNIVIENGGQVTLVPLTIGFSTTNILDKISKENNE